MGRSRWGMPVALFLATLVGVGVHSAGGTSGAQASPLNASSIRARRATPGEQLWLKRYKTGDIASDLGVSPDGSKVFVTGPSSNNNATVAYDAATGTGLWASSYDGDFQGCCALGVSPDGSKVFITGTSSGDFATVAYDAVTGGQLWVMRYNNPQGVSDSAFALDVSPDGSRVFVTGTTLIPMNSYDYATVAYDASDGTELWVMGYNHGDNDVPSDVEVSPDGSRVFVTGGSNNDYATVTYDAATGTGLWVRRYSNRPGNFQDQATALGVSPDGRQVFVTGQSTGTTSVDYTTVAYNAVTGRERWVSRYDGGTIDAAYDLRVSPDGSLVFVTGDSVGSNSSDDYVTVAYNASTGGQMWLMRYNGPQNRGDFPTGGLEVSPDGSQVFVAGLSYRSTGLSADYATVAYDAPAGTQLWVHRYNSGPGKTNDVAYAFGVSPNGSAVFVTGGSGSNGSYDFVTIAYSII